MGDPCNEYHIPLGPCQDAITKLQPRTPQVQPCQTDRRVGASVSASEFLAICLRSSTPIDRALIGQYVNQSTSLYHECMKSEMPKRGSGKWNGGGRPWVPDGPRSIASYDTGAGAGPK